MVNEWMGKWVWSFGSPVFKRWLILNVKIVKPIVTILIALVTSVPVDATVIFHDGICVEDREVFLRAETKKGLFRKGGILLEFFVNGRSVGVALSGGDGIAYKAFIPKGTGLFKIKVSSLREKEEVEGLLLCLRKRQAVILIDIETLRESPFAVIPKKDSIPVLKKLYKRFPIIYLKTAPVSMVETKRWLAQKGFPEGPIFESIEELFSELKELGIPIRAVVGTEEVAMYALQSNIKVFSFEEIEGAIEVDTWKDVEKELLRLPETKKK